MSSEDLVKTTKEYYDSADADEFYYHVWGGEDIHVGLYDPPDEPILNASMKTVKKMASMIKIDQNTKILDIGAGYGGAARYLAKNYQCKVVCLNLSDKENARNEEKNKAQGLQDLIDVIGGNFEDLPFDDDAFDVVWCEDSILHSGNKGQVFSEVARVLKSGGDFIFTDPMQSDDCPEGVLQPVLDRIHLKEMGSVKKYREWADEYKFDEVEVLEYPHQLVNHYSNVLKQLNKKQDELKDVVSNEYVERMKTGLNHWVEAGNNGYLNWGILHFRKK